MQGLGFRVQGVRERGHEVVSEHFPVEICTHLVTECSVRVQGLGFGV